MMLRKFLHIALLLFCFQQVSAQSPVSWMYIDSIAGTTSNIYIYDMEYLGQDGYIAAGSEGTKPVVTRLNIYGEVVWRRKYNFFGDIPFAGANGIGSYALKAIPTRDGGFLIGVGQATNLYPGWMMKIDAVGDTLWTRLTNEFNGAGAEAMNVFPDGRIVVNTAATTPYPNNHIPIMEIWDSTGNFIRKDTIQNTSYERVYAVRTAEDDNYYIVGKDSMQNLIVYKNDTAGNTIWNQSIFPNPQRLLIEPWSVQMTADSNLLVILAQDYDTTLLLQYRYRLFSISPSGTVNWETVVPDSFAAPGNFGFNNILHTMAQATNGDIYITIHLGTQDKLFKVSKNGTALWHSNLVEPPGVLTNRLQASCPGPNSGLVISGYLQANFPRPAFAALLDSMGDFRYGLLRGKVFRDDNQDCQPQAGERGIVNSWVSNEIGNYAAFTDSAGDFEFLAPVGNQKITVTPAANLWEPLWAVTCPTPDTHFVNVSGAVQIDTISNLDFALEPLVSCPKMVVDLSQPWLRFCDTARFYVNYCNYGTIDADSSYIILSLDSHFTWLPSNLPATPLGNNEYRVDVGTVPFGTCQDFTFDLLTPCNINLLGRTFCFDAHIFPDSSCLPPDPIWNGASLRVQGECVNGDSVRFVIENTGFASMNLPTSVWVVEDDILRMTSQVQLGSGQDSVFVLAANGSTWTTIVDQVAGHPGPSLPRAFVEGCGLNAQNSISTGFVNQFAEDDLYPYISVECQELRGAYDPNDKRGFPMGHGPEGLIEANTEIEYMIRFQNTGTDTAFKVLVRDRIPENLQLNTLVPGASSHPYTFRVRADRVVEWVFEPIVLPDSGVNLVGSQGFLKFSIRQEPDLPDGSEIKNAAGIYFDFNPAVLTDTALHTIGELELILSIDEPTDPKKQQIKVWPNPAVTEVNFDLGSFQNGLNLELYDLNGQLARKVIPGAGTSFKMDAQGLTEGIYIFRIHSKEGFLGSGKIIVRQR